MTDNDPQTTGDPVEWTPDDVTAPSAETTNSSTYKVLGKHAASNGTGVLGENTAGSGTPIGVEGRVPNATSNGYGLYTPDNAKVDRILTAGGAVVLGDLIASRVRTGGKDFTVEAGSTTTGDAQNVVHGHASNGTSDGAVGVTIGGGGFDDTSTVRPNQVHDHYGTVAGGRGNVAGASNGIPDGSEYATIGGGENNEASYEYATVGGGNKNTARANEATVGGGFENFARARSATIGGGWHNEAQGKYATIAGGAPSDRTDSSSQYNSRNVVYDDYGTIGGGGKNQAGKENASGTNNGIYATVSGGRNNTASGKYATIPGGFFNEANGRSSFAAGRSAKADHDGSFVWADSGNLVISSTGPDQFLVDASGGMGVGTDDPATQLHVTAKRDGPASVSNHVAVVENTDTGGSADVLALKIGETGDLESSNNFLTFKNGDGTTLGAIEGDGSGGVTNASAGADYAEWLPQADPNEPIKPGDVVGVHAGEIRLDTGDADRTMVVTRQPVVAGNDPGPEPAARQGHQQVAFVGQAPVKVHGPVEAGQLVVPSGDHDGTARAVSPEEWIHSDDSLVGCAWEDDDADGVTEVTVAVGLETGEALAATVADQQATIDHQQATIDELQAETEGKDDRIAALEDETDDLQAETSDLQAENEALRDHLAILEDRISAVETADADGPAPADD